MAFPCFFVTYARKDFYFRCCVLGIHLKVTHKEIPSHCIFIALIKSGIPATTIKQMESNAVLSVKFVNLEEALCEICNLKFTLLNNTCLTLLK